MTPLNEQGNYIADDTTLTAGAVASAARTSSGNGTAFETVRTNSIEGYLTVTAATAPTSLDVRLETSLDAGSTWQTVAAFAQVTASTGTRNKVFGPLGDSCRWAWTIVGTSFTFAVAAEANN